LGTDRGHGPLLELARFEEGVPKAQGPSHHEGLRQTDPLVSSFGCHLHSLLAPPGSRQLQFEIALVPNIPVSASLSNFSGGECSC